MCKECPYPLYVYENICMVVCPPHYYESDGNSSTYPQRHCLPCYRTCERCSGPEETHCLDCSPHSTFNPERGTCSHPSYSWTMPHKVKQSMDRTAAVLGIMIGSPVLVLCVMTMGAWLVSRTSTPCLSQLTTVAQQQDNHTNSASQGSITNSRHAHDATDMGMIVVSLIEDQAEGQIENTNLSTILEENRLE